MTTTTASPQAQSNKHRATVRALTALAEQMPKTVAAVEEARINGGASDAEALRTAHEMFVTVEQKFEAEAEARYVGGDPETAQGIRDHAKIVMALIESKGTAQEGDPQAEAVADLVNDLYDAETFVGGLLWSHEREWNARNIDPVTRSLVAQNID